MSSLSHLLEKIVSQSTEVEAIFIFNFEDLCIDYHNNQLKDTNPELFDKLVGESGISEAVSNFTDLRHLPKVFNKFGEETQCGDLEFVLFWLTQLLMITSFINVDGKSCAICYLSRDTAVISKLIIDFQNSIKLLDFHNKTTCPQPNIKLTFK